MYVDGSSETCIRWGAHYHNLANITELSMCGSIVAFLSNYFDRATFNRGAISAMHGGQQWAPVKVQ